MSQTENNAPNMGDDSTFPSHTAPNSNPFTADMKGEFTSNFGTNTNAAVSQIFKDGGFGQENKTKYFLLGGLFLVLAIFGLVYLYPTLMGPEPAAMVPPAANTEVQPPVETTETVATEELDTSATAMEEMATEEEISAPVEDAMPMDVAPMTATEPTTAQTTGPATLISPENGYQTAYDETQAPMQFNWSGKGTIVFSRSSSMRPAMRRVTANGSYTFMHPMVGTWYWNVVTPDGGASEVRSFIVNAPVRRNIAITAPAEGAVVSGTDATVAWQGDNNVTYYRVEMVNSGSSDWGNPSYRFQTSSENAQIKDVAPGEYKMRLGAFSQVSGRFEYTAPRAISIQ